jgi:integrase
VERAVWRRAGEVPAEGTPLMHDLIPLGPAALPALGTLTDAEIDATMAYGAAEKALATRAAYLSDWRDFAAWCALRGAPAMPAHQGMVAAYLSWLADSGRKASTIGRRAAAIGYHHKMAGHEPPTSAEGVRAVLRGIRRTIGAATAQKTAITAAQVVEIMKTCPATLIGRRDAALISFGFLSAMRRSELIALTMDDITEVPDGLRIRIRRSKTDGEGRGQEIAIPRGARIRPVEAVQTWLAVANISTGHVFRPVSKGGYVGEGAMTPEAVALVVKKLCARIGDPAAYAGHSMRSGFVTAAVEANAPVLKIAEQTRHRSLDMLRVYSRRADLFRDHASAGFA